MVSLKNSLSQKVWNCAESDSTQYRTATSQEMERSKNPKFSNTVWSPILPCSVGLHQVKQFFFHFQKLISTTSRIYVMIFYNTAQMRRVGLLAMLDNFGFSEISISQLSTVWYEWSWTCCSAILCGVRLSAVSHCTDSRFSWISSWKRIFQWNNLSLFIRDPNGFNSWKK